MNQNHLVEAAPPPKWAEMSVDQKAAFLEHMAHRLERLGDRLGAETARAWADGVLRKETGVRPDPQRAEPIPRLTPRQTIDRLYEVAKWAEEAGGGRYLSGRLLRHGCQTIARNVEKELQQQREGRER